jgi:hypothetical protein
LEELEQGQEKTCLYTLILQKPNLILIPVNTPKGRCFSYQTTELPEPYYAFSFLSGT